MKLLRNLWKDEGGFVVTVELVLVATLLVIGLVTGLQLLRDAVVSELVDTAQAFGAINQSFAYSQIGDATSVSSGGGAFADAADIGLDGTANSGATTGSGPSVLIVPNGALAVGQTDSEDSSATVAP